MQNSVSYALSNAPYQWPSPLLRRLQARSVKSIFEGERRGFATLQAGPVAEASWLPGSDMVMAAGGDSLRPLPVINLTPTMPGPTLSGALRHFWAYYQTSDVGTTLVPCHDGQRLVTISEFDRAGPDPRTELHHLDVWDVTTQVHQERYMVPAIKSRVRTHPTFTPNHTFASELAWQHGKDSIRVAKISPGWLAGYSAQRSPMLAAPHMKTWVQYNLGFPMPCHRVMDWTPLDIRWSPSGEWLAVSQYTRHGTWQMGGYFCLLCPAQGKRYTFGLIPPPQGWSGQPLIPGAFSPDSTVYAVWGQPVQQIHFGLYLVSLRTGRTTPWMGYASLRRPGPSQVLSISWPHKDYMLLAAAPDFSGRLQLQDSRIYLLDAWHPAGVVTEWSSRVGTMQAPPKWQGHLARDAWDAVLVNTSYYVILLYRGTRIPSLTVSSAEPASKASPLQAHHVSNPLATKNCCISPNGRLLVDLQVAAHGRARAWALVHRSLTAPAWVMVVPNVAPATRRCPCYVKPAWVPTRAYLYAVALGRGRADRVCIMSVLSHLQLFSISISELQDPQGPIHVTWADPADFIPPASCWAAFNSDCENQASSSDDGSVRGQNYDDEGPLKGITSMIWSPDGRHLAVTADELVVLANVP